MPGAESTVISPDVIWNNTGQIHKIYLQHWEYNRADPHLQGFLANTSMYSQADDHEVIDDYGGNWSYYNSTKRPGYHNLVTSGITTFFNFSPIGKNKEDPTRIYLAHLYYTNMTIGFKQLAVLYFSLTNPYKIPALPPLRTLTL
jgi:PhoD-like phosphatase